MNNGKRALLCIQRNIWKSLLITLVFAILCSITLLTPLITEALGNIKDGLILKTKPIIMVHYRLLENIGDEETWNKEKRLHKETFEEFSEKLDNFKSDDRIKKINYSLYKYIFSDICSTHDNVDEKKLMLYGVDDAYFPDLYNYNINIISGKNLTQNEIDYGEEVCIVSDKLLINGNYPVIGDMVPIEICCFDSINGYPYYSLENLKQREIINLKIVGFFHGNIKMFDYDSNYSEYSQYIYCPKKIVEKCQQINEKQLEENNIQITADGDLFNYYYPGIRDITVELFDRESINTVKEELFKKYDYLNRGIGNLNNTGEPIEQYYYHESIEDIYNRSSWIIDNMAKTTTMVKKISFLVFFIMTVVITVILLKTREREIGIYLSLGEKSEKLVKQIIKELLVLNATGLICAIIIVVLSVKPINSVLMSNMMRAEASTGTTDDNGNLISREAIIDLNEIINETEIKLNKRSIETNIIVEVITIVIAGAVVSFKVTRIKPKKLLLE